MKKLSNVYLCAAFILPAIVFASCASGASASGSGGDFKDVQGKGWTLLEIRSQGKTVSLDRSKLAAGFPEGVYTINFEEVSAGNEGRVSGVGAPNRYTGPYTFDSNKAISIGLLASTKMLALKEPDELKENDFFAYLAKVKRWDLNSGKLELYSANDAGAETVLVFGL